MKGVANRYSLAVGLLFLAVIVVAAIHTLNGGGEDTLGLEVQPVRWPLPEFAVPAAVGQLEGDANVYQDDCESSSLPCPDGSTRLPACQITTPGAIRVCDLFDRPLVISFWFGTESGCEAQQNVVSTVAARYRGRVNFLSLDVRDSRGSVRELVRERGWFRGRALSGRRLPDLRLRLSRRHSAERQHRRTWRQGAQPTCG